MAIAEFPDPETADPSGLLAVGGDLEVHSLLLAYSQGIFPWPVPEYPLAWFAPPERAIIEPQSFHLSRSFYRWLKGTPYSVTCNDDFTGTIAACSEEHDLRGGGTWITSELIDGYTELHRAGFGYSIEVWSEPSLSTERELVGGLYGVAIGGMVSAESMFHRADNCSKLALFALVQLCKAQAVNWIDVQVLNPFTESVGALEISRKEFTSRLRSAIKRTPPVQFNKGPVTFR